MQTIYDLFESLPSALRRELQTRDAELADALGDEFERLVGREIATLRDELHEAIKGLDERVSGVHAEALRALTDVLDSRARA